MEAAALTDLAPALKAECRRASVLLRQGNSAVELLDAELPAVIEYLTRVLEERRQQAETAWKREAVLREALTEIHADHRARLSTLEETETGTRWTDRDERTFSSQPE